MFLAGAVPALAAASVAIGIARQGRLRLQIRPARTLTDLVTVVGR
jgi:hypothetical protein